MHHAGRRAHEPMHEVSRGQVKVSRPRSAFPSSRGCIGNISNKVTVVRNHELTVVRTQKVQVYVKSAGIACRVSCIYVDRLLFHLVSWIRTMKTWQKSLLVCCGFLACTSYVSSTCVGNSCPKEHESAAAAGLLGSTVSAPSCSPTTYPKGSDKLKPVSAFVAKPCLEVSA